MARPHRRPAVPSHALSVGARVTLDPSNVWAGDLTVCVDAALPCPTETPNNSGATIASSKCSGHSAPGNANPAAPAAPAARPAARNFGNYHGTWELVPFVNRTFERGAVIATFLSVLSTVRRHCARLTYSLHPKLRKINAVPITPQLMPAAHRKPSPGGGLFTDRATERS